MLGPRRWREWAPLLYSGPTPPLLFTAFFFYLIAFAVKMLENAANGFQSMMSFKPYTSYVKMDFTLAIIVSAMIGTFFVAIALVEYIARSDSKRLEYMVMARLCKYKYGNPLRLKEGQLIPRVSVTQIGKRFVINISCPSADPEDVSSLEGIISSSLVGKFIEYSVVDKNEDLAFRGVDYIIENVIEQSNKQDVIRYLGGYDDKYPSGSSDAGRSYILPIRGDIAIDFSKVMNASILMVGRTRSGKTSACLSIILPLLARGPDMYGSRIVIVDPKNAEMSQCPYVLSPKEDGDVSHIMEALIEFDNLRISRQHAINDIGAQMGKTVKWWDVGMNPSVLFLDEYVSMIGLVPKKGTTLHPEYNAENFKTLIRRIATQGASAGCFLALSIAEASVGTGGLETIVNLACGIRALFKPTREEALYLWSKEKLEPLRERNYSAGEAWLSIDDGINNNPKLVKFPLMDFGEYEVLTELMEAYHAKQV